MNSNGQFSWQTLFLAEKKQLPSPSAASVVLTDIPAIMNTHSLPNSLTCRSDCIWMASLQCASWSVWWAHRSVQSATHSLPMNICRASHLKIKTTFRETGHLGTHKAQLRLSPLIRFHLNVMRLYFAEIQLLICHQNLLLLLNKNVDNPIIISEKTRPCAGSCEGPTRHNNLMPCGSWELRYVVSRSRSSRHLCNRGRASRKKTREWSQPAWRLFNHVVDEGC